MQQKYHKQFDQISQSPFLHEGIPTQWQIIKQINQNIFSFNLSNYQSCVDKYDLIPTDQIIQQNNSDSIYHISHSKNNSLQEIQQLLPQICDHHHNLSNQIFQCEQLQELQKKQNTQIKIKQIKIKQIKLPIKTKRIKSKKRGTRSTRRKNRGRPQFSSQTKNIPKNFGKQIIKFIKKQKPLTQKLLKSISSRYTPDHLNTQLKKKKKSLNKISDLRRLWLTLDCSKQLRIMTCIFLRKYCLSWVFNSRIKNIKYPIKYRYRIMEGVEKPEQFLYLKDF